MFEESRLMEIGAFVYMTLISSEENRTMRFGILAAIFNLIPFEGSTLGPYFYERFGYAGLIMTCLCFFILGLVVLVRVLEGESRDLVSNVVSSTERYCRVNLGTHKTVFLIQIEPFKNYRGIGNFKSLNFFHEHNVLLVLILIIEGIRKPVLQIYFWVS
jgi:MFS family permease